MHGLSTAFFYGARVPRALAQRFDRLVIDVDNLVAMPARCRARLFAYVSLGELGPGRPWRHLVPDDVVAGRNGDWGSEIVDARHPAWRPFIVEHVLPGILRPGIEGLFLDTLDSFRSVEPIEARWPSHHQALAGLIDTIRERHPGLKILLNRGWGLLPFLKAPPDGVVVESLFRTADAGGRGYRPVPAGDTAALLGVLRGLRAANIPVVVIDYVPANDPGLRRTTARRIAEEGFQPYIAVPQLDGVGMGRAIRRPTPRRS